MLILYVLLGIFSESVARGLEVYGENQPGFLQTSRFVTFVLNIWKIMSVKTVSKGILYTYIRAIVKAYGYEPNLTRGREEKVESALFSQSFKCIAVSPFPI